MRRPRVRALPSEARGTLGNDFWPVPGSSRLLSSHAKHNTSPPLPYGGLTLSSNLLTRLLGSCYGPAFAPGARGDCPWQVRETDQKRAVKGIMMQL